MRSFDYSFLKQTIYEECLGLTEIIYDLRAKESLRINDNKRFFEALRQTARIETVRSSNAIEGIVTTADRLEDLIEERITPESHGENEILGYRMALDEIYSEFAPELSEDYIKHVHFLIMEHSSREAGHYKTRNNWIQERDERGRIKVRFVPVSAGETGVAMEQLLMTYREARQDSGINQLLLSICFVVDFLCIHPFMDGNGRVSRLLTSLLLQDAGFDIGKYISVDKKIDVYKDNYYRALSESSKGWHECRNTYEPFITLMLQIIYQCYKELDNCFIQDSTSKIPKSKQIENALLNAYTPISKSELKEKFPHIGIKTIEKVLGDMVRKGSITKIGSFKDARYKKK